jgi:hypothetical protein
MNIRECRASEGRARMTHFVLTKVRTDQQLNAQSSVGLGLDYRSLNCARSLSGSVTGTWHVKSRHA